MPQTGTFVGFFLQMVKSVKSLSVAAIDPELFTTLQIRVACPMSHGSHHLVTLYHSFFGANCHNMFTKVLAVYIFNFENAFQHSLIGSFKVLLQQQSLFFLITSNKYKDTLKHHLSDLDTQDEICRSLLF